jgi:hypothetical protein
MVTNSSKQPIEVEAAVDGYWLQELRVNNENACHSSI